VTVKKWKEKGDITVKSNEMAHCETIKGIVSLPFEENKL
jgi:hypothetical protein